MDNFSVMTVVSGKSGAQTLVEHLTGALPDPEYIEGAILLSIGNAHLLGSEHHDLVDQLWAYLIDGLLSLLESGLPFECFFPDQPMRIQIRLLQPDVVEFRVGDSPSKVSAVSLTSAIGVGGRHFFLEMKRIVPLYTSTWDEYIVKAERLLAKV